MLTGENKVSIIIKINGLLDLQETYKTSLAATINQIFHLACNYWLITSYFFLKYNNLTCVCGKRWNHLSVAKVFIFTAKQRGPKIDSFGFPVITQQGGAFIDTTSGEGVLEVLWVAVMFCETGAFTVRSTLFRSAFAFNTSWNTTRKKT